ncbi:MAG: AAA family ATPase [Nitratireductor sp.]
MTDELTHEQRLFKRRERITKAGQRLPTEEELLRGMSFFREDLAEDVREFGERLARRLRKRQRTDLALLVSHFEELTVERSCDSVAALQAALDEVPDVPGFSVDSTRIRCLIYRAGFGDPEAAAAVAAEMALVALKDLKDSGEKRMLWCALSWAAFSRDLAEWRRSDVERSPANSLGSEYDLRSYIYHFRKAIRPPKPVVEETADDPQSDAPVEVAGKERSAPAEEPAPGTVIVVREVGNVSISQGKQVGREFESIVGRALPLPVTPDLAAVRTSLLEEFPHAGSIVDQVLRGLQGRQHLRIRPTILLGTPGCGKSRFARRLAEELGTPYELIPCGGMSDSYLGGTPRRWSSGEPSLPILSVRRHECAGPVIILDEIEKVGTSRHNGNPHDVLVGLFEAETSSRWHDPYIQANCDLSHLSWLMTANDIGPVPTVLRDRCRILRFPAPGVEHLSILALRIMERLYVELGHDVRWATPLEGFELDAIASTWGGGSIRRLERIIEQLVEVREWERPPQ